jgi:hypothetical protein
MSMETFTMSREHKQYRISPEMCMVKREHFKERKRVRVREKSVKISAEKYLRIREEKNCITSGPDG